MLSLLIEILIVLLIAGVIGWAINALAFIPAPVKMVGNAFLAILLIIYLVSLLGVFGPHHLWIR